jgi:hypothetical protein
MRPGAGSHIVQWRFARHKSPEHEREAVDPDGMFALLVLAGVALVLGAAILVPVPLILPLVSLAALAAAAVVALFAWRTGAQCHTRRMSAWDVAGAFALIGFGAGMISDPTHVLHLFGAAETIP